MPYKLSMWIVIGLLAFNGAAVMLNASGAADYMGVSPDPGENENLTQAKEDTQDFQTGSGQGQTLFGLYNSLASPVRTAVNGIFPAARMLRNVGVPAYIVTWLFAGLSVIPGFDLITFLRSG